MKQWKILCFVCVCVLCLVLIAGCSKEQPVGPSDTPTAATSAAAPAASINQTQISWNCGAWSLQQPDGSQISSICSYSSSYFYNASDGSKTFYAPRTGSTTPNSNYTRSELRQKSNWSTSGTHSMSATLKVVSTPGTVCVGQIHIGTGSPSSTKPTCELYYRTSGEILIGVENAPTGGQTLHSIGSASMGSQWSYTLKLSGRTLTVTVKGSSHTYTLNSAFQNYTHYFKAGCYNQSTGSGAGKVQFYSISGV